MGAMSSLTCPACRRIAQVTHYDPSTPYRCPNCGTEMLPSRLAAPQAVPADSGGAPPAEVEAAAKQPDRRLGKFVLVEVVGSGAMGKVWRGWDTSLRRFVAVKVMNWQQVSAEDLARFRREARVEAALEHPNIAPIYEMGEQGGRHFIAMKFIEGETLERFFRVPEGARPDTRAIVAAMKEACAAVAYAHSKGIVHRDLKPSNIMRERDGRIVVMDFGLAKALATAGITMVGRRNILGTPAFMSPEAARGLTGGVDARADVFSLGASLFTLLARRHLFPAATGLQQLQRAASEEAPRLRSAVPDAPAALDDIVARATAQHKLDRHPSAAELERDLESFLASMAAAPAAAAAAGERRALVVDDDRQVLPLLCRLCEELGFRVTPCGDIATARAAAARGHVTLVVVDEGLPDGSGFQLIQALRKIPGTRSAKIVMVTGLPPGDDTQRAFDSGADEYMSKPLKMKEFKARVRHLLGL